MHRLCQAHKKIETKWSISWQQKHLLTIKLLTVTGTAKASWFRLK